MGLDIIDKKIVGNIDNLEDKLEGKLPVDRLELLYLVNSWGRHYKFYISGVNNMEIEQCEPTQSEQTFYQNATSNQLLVKKFVRKECYDLSKLDTSEITNMDYIFKYSLFSGNINLWDVSNVSTMNEMFDYAKNFNQALNQWKTSNVINMSGMFRSSVFNQDISQWDVSKVTNMNEMFSYARYFNQNINSWDVSNVIYMLYMFHKSREFNQPLNQWNTSKVIDMKGMFSYAESFNQDISSWDVLNVTNMRIMFAETKMFNQNIGNWNLDNIIDCDFMFDKAKTFLDKYNGGKPLPICIDKIKRWFNLNRDKMIAIDIKDKYGDEIDGFFINVHSKNKDVLNELNKMDK